MKFTNGYWMDRAGYAVRKARGLRDLAVEDDGAVVAHAPVRPVATRGDTLNVGLLSASFRAVADGRRAASWSRSTSATPARRSRTWSRK